MADAPLKYWAFISYSHADRRWADWLHRSLERYPIPVTMAGRENPRGERIPTRFKPVFRDREELAAADDLGREINAALAASRYLIVICSRRAAASPWVEKEIVQFKRHGREDRVRCLIVDGEPWASRGGSSECSVEDECFPSAVRHRLGDDSELSDATLEPIAADARPQSDGRENAFLKLLAGLLGVEFDALKRRDEEFRRRQMRKTRLLATLFAFLAIAATAAGIYASRQRTAALTALSRADFEYGSEQIESGATAQGAAYLARALRNDPRNRAVAARLWSLLAQRTHLLPMAPAIHLASDLFHLEYSPDGQRLLIRTVAEGARFLDPISGLYDGPPFQPDGWSFRETHFRPGSAELITFGDFSTVTSEPELIRHDAALQRWDFATRTPIGAPTPTGLDLRFPRVAFDPAGRWIAIWDYDGAEVSVWDIDAGKRIGPPIKVNGRISRVVIFPGGKAIAVIADRTSLHVFNPETGEAAGPPASAGKDGTYEDLRIIDGKALVLLTGLNDRQQRIWQVVDGATQKPLGFFPDADYALRGGELDPTGFRMLAAGMDGRAHFVAMRGSGQRLAEPVPHRGSQPPLFAPNGRQIATQFDSRTIVLRHSAPSLPGGRTLLSTRGAQAAVLSPDGSRLLVRREKDELALFDATNGQPVGAAMKHDDLINSFGFSGNGQQIASTSLDGTARIWSAADGAPLTEPLQQGPYVNSAQFSGDGRHLLVVNALNRVSLWRCDGGIPLAKCEGLGMVRDVAFSADGGEFHFARGRSVEFWGVDPAVRLREIKIDGLGNIDAAATSPDGKTIATCIGLSTRLWNAKTGKALSTWITLLEPAKALRFDPSGKFLLTMTPNELRIWRVSDGIEAAPPLRRRGLKRADFSPDGALLLTTYGIKARLWDWRSGRAVTDEFPSVFEATFSTDGRHILRGNNYIAEIAATPPAEEAPPWLAPVAESVFHERLRSDGVIETVPAEAWISLRDALSRLSGADFWSRFGRWFAADPWSRSVSLDSSDLTEDFLKAQLPEIQAILHDEEPASAR